MQINMSPKIVQWIHNFLLNRPQWVKIGDVNSKVKITNTGAPSRMCYLTAVIFIQV